MHRHANQTVIGFGARRDVLVEQRPEGKRQRSPIARLVLYALHGGLAFNHGIGDEMPSVPQRTFNT
jgi:hypothetical protein